MKESVKLLPIALILAIPVIFLGSWMFANSQLPISDAANYMSTAVELSGRFETHGFFSGLKSLYLLRGWRPIFYPVIFFLFMGLSQGKLQLAYTLLSLSVMVATVGYIYAFLRLKLEPLPSAIATAFIGCVPVLLAPIILMFAESALFPCIIGSLYHLYRSDYFRHKQHTIWFVCLASLGLLIRPAELVMHLIFVIAACLYVGLHKRVFTLKQIKTLLMISVSFVAAFFACMAIRYVHTQASRTIDNGGPLDQKMMHIVLKISQYLIVLMALMAAYLFFHYRKFVSQFVTNVYQDWSKRSYMLPALLAVMLISFTWFAPYALQTFEWMYRTSFGDVAAGQGDSFRVNTVYQLFRQHLIAEGMVAVLGSLALALFSCVVINKQILWRVLRSEPVIYLFLLMPIPLLEVINTIQNTPRKMSVIFPALLMAFMMLSLQRGRLYYLRLVGVIALLIAQLALMSNLIHPSLLPITTERSNYLVGALLPPPAKIKPNPHNVLVSYLLEQNKRYTLNNIAFQINPNHALPLISLPVDPFLMSTLMDATQTNMHGGYPYFPVYHSDTVANMTKRYDAVMLADLSDRMRIGNAFAERYKMMIDNETDASMKTFYDFLYHYANNTLEATGWRVADCVKLEAADHLYYKSCLLLPKH